MTVTVASFRADFREFADTDKYPPAAIAYWLGIAQIMLGIGVSSAPQVAAFTGSVVGQVLTVTAINFGSLSLLPLLLTGNGVPASAFILSQITGPQGGPGDYNVNFSSNIASGELVALGNTTTTGSNPYWGSPSVAATSPPTTMADFATELFLAHNLVLEKQALDAATRGADPGTTIGVVTSKSVGGVSVSYDISQIVDQNSGFWGTTMYGLRFIRLARLRGMGPIQIGIGIAPSFMFLNSWGLSGSYNGWGGPFPGIAPSDTGFG